MPYIEEEGGLINNFAVEPKVYEAEPPSASQKRNFAIMGVGGVLLVGLLIFVAFSASQVG